MSKCKQYDVSLIKIGKLDEELHFGVFGRYWLQSRDNVLYLIRLGMKTLNNTHFIITVVKGTSVAAFQPGYICEANGVISSVYDTPSGAINFLYHTLFSSKTRFSGPLICGFNNEEINKQLLDDVPFQPFTLTVNNLQMFIGMIGVSDQESFGYAGPGYLSSFIYRISVEKIKTLFVQQIHQRHCLIVLYQDEQIKFKFSEKNPNKVWKEVWEKIEFTPANTPWYEFLLNWKEHNCNIIKLYSALKNIYPEEYQFKKRELRAWKALLHSIGCTNITPFEKDKSEKEFWTKTENPADNKHIFLYLYENNFLDISLPDDHSNPIVNKFWSCFNESLKANKKGSDGKRRILSIIANDFSYEEIKSNLLLEGNRYQYREDMGGLCATCNTYGYEVFGCLKNLIQKEINSIEIQNNFIQCAENLQRFLKRSYEQKFIISENGTTKHNPCINHCLLYAFRTCDKLHTQIRPLNVMIGTLS
ncbi:hypothetical protein RclHR1_04530014 [Rhizophagus clarus]|uniref:Uncharacterized protein n=1 Tax=Rhizophagus clarus TaxID=94130 RepID=A0A2Z6S0I0_9GLOM|nr:hypothetical protein RclHR1_04530014 [Rhizophagus clarus]